MSPATHSELSSVGLDVGFRGAGSAYNGLQVALSSSNVFVKALYTLMQYMQIGTSYTSNNSQF